MMKQNFLKSNKKIRTRRNNGLPERRNPEWDLPKSDDGCKGGRSVEITLEVGNEASYKTQKA